jgi:hypothetical protein
MKLIPICLPFAFLMIAPVSVAQVELSVGNVDLSAGTMDIYMANDVPVAAFQFDVKDLSGVPINMTGFGFGGTAGTANFSVQGAAAGVVIGFSFVLNTIPPSGGVPVLLTHLPFIGNPQDVCLSSCVISDPVGLSIPVVAAGCLSLPITDCNANGIDDGVDVFHGVSTDLNGDGILDECQELKATPASISLSTGGVQNFELDAGLGHAGELYLLLGSLSGTVPGTPIGSLTLPLNYDWYMAFCIQSVNAGPFNSTYALLDGLGRGNASLTLPPLLAPTLVGMTVHHAYLTIELLSFSESVVSNPAALLLTL